MENAYSGARFVAITFRPDSRTYMYVNPSKWVSVRYGFRGTRISDRLATVSCQMVMVSLNIWRGSGGSQELVLKLLEISKMIHALQDVSEKVENIMQPRESLINSY